jgi:cytochrome c
MALVKNQIHFFTESAQMIKSFFSLATASAVLALVSISPAQAAVDADAAQTLFKKNDCTKCHAVDKSKKGPSLQKIAAKYKGKADGEEKVIKNMTTSPKVKLDDGTEEEHKTINTKDQAAIKNLAAWILSQ